VAKLNDPDPNTKYQSNPNRKSKITALRTKENLNTTLRASYFSQGTRFIDDLEVYKIPKDELRLNWRNHRLRDKVNELIEERKKSKYKVAIPDDFDVEDKRKKDESEPDDLGGDGFQIQELIKGKEIGDIAEDADKKSDYRGQENSIFNLMEKHSRKGGNGQRVAGVITPDGLLINGNRRYCVLDDLFNEAVENEDDPSDYSYMYVGICPDSITNLDIMFMELFEQASKDNPEPFHRMNYAGTLREAYDGLVLQQKKKPKGDQWDESIVAILAAAPTGVSVDEIVEHLDLHEFAKKILKRIKTFNEKILTPEQDLSRISIDRHGESSKVLQIVFDGSKKFFGRGKTKTKPMAADKKINHIKKIAAYIKGTWIDVVKDDNGDTRQKGSGEHVWNSDLGSGRGTNKDSLWAADTRFDTDEYWAGLEKKFGWDDDGMFIEFGKDIEDEIDDIKAQNSIKEPVKFAGRLEKNVRDLTKKITTGTKISQNRIKKTLVSENKVDSLKKTTRHLAQVVMELDPTTKNCPTCGHVLDSKTKAKPRISNRSKSTSRSTTANIRKRRVSAAKKAAKTRKRRAAAAQRKRNAAAKKAAHTRKRNKKNKR